jgi:hypothetical protein
VCREPLDTIEAHTYHSDECPMQDPEGHLNLDAECIEYGGCNADVHEDCCPTCNPGGTDGQDSVDPA